MQKKRPLDGVLLVSDLDGTLLTDQFEIPPRSLAAITRFMEEGGLFSLATGRTEYSAGRYAARVSANAPGILYNGAVIYDFSKEAFIWNASMPPEVKTVLQTILKAFPEVGAQIYSLDFVSVVNPSELITEHVSNEGIQSRVRELDEKPRQWIKLLFAAPEKRIAELESYAAAMEHKGIACVKSCPIYFEMLPEGASKGETLLRLAQMLGIKKENTAAVGDYYNDIELVSSAGTGFAPAGAPQEVKAAAGHVVGSCEDGAVADVIEYLEHRYMGGNA